MAVVAVRPGQRNAHTHTHARERGRTARQSLCFKPRKLLNSQGIFNNFRECQHGRSLSPSPKNPIYIFILSKARYIIYRWFGKYEWLQRKPTKLLVWCAVEPYLPRNQHQCHIKRSRMDRLMMTTMVLGIKGLQFDFR